MPVPGRAFLVAMGWTDGTGHVEYDVLQPVEPMDGVLATAAVAKLHVCKIGEPERLIQLVHHQKAAVGTELFAGELQPHTTVEIRSISL